MLACCLETDTLFTAVSANKSNRTIRAFVDYFVAPIPKLGRLPDRR